MIYALLVLLLCQTTGEVVTRTLGLPVPGPVLGMIALVLLLSVFPRLVDLMRPVAQGFLGNLSLLFVPAGVGVVGHVSVLGDQALGIGLAILVSTGLAIAAGALTFAFVAKYSNSPPDNADTKISDIDS